MKSDGASLRSGFAGATVLLILGTLVVWPHADLSVSQLFYHPGGGFFLDNHPLFDWMHTIAYGGARLLGLIFFLLLFLSFRLQKPVFGLKTKAWLFLFLGLVLGPGLVANGVFKDHWGRARPTEIVEFGGGAHFTPALVMANQCQRNCSFISGDGAFGFFFPAFGYVVPLNRSRRYFWGGIGLGAVFGLARIVVGAHFLSDTLFAGFFMQLTFAFLHALMYGSAETRKYWRNWIFLSEKSEA